MNESERFEELEYRIDELQSEINHLKETHKRFYLKIEQILDDHNML